VFDAGLHPSVVVAHGMSVKLDRLTVGSILKQRMVFLISVLSMRMQIRIGHRPLHILLPGFAEDPDDERMMDGH
jgi:hypothetical protein